MRKPDLENGYGRDGNSEQDEGSDLFGNAILLKDPSTASDLALRFGLREEQGPSLGRA